MEPIARLTKTPQELISTDGKVYKLSPLEPIDLGELEVWIADLPIHKMKRQLAILGDSLSVEQRTAMLHRAFDESNEQSSLAKPKSQEILESLEGISKILYLCMRKNHPEITMQEVSTVCTMENMVEIEKRLEALNALDKSSEDENSGPKQ